MKSEVPVPVLINFCLVDFVASKSVRGTQITGSFPAVKKALFAVSGCLQDTSYATKPLGPPVSHANCMPVQDEEPSPKRRYTGHHNAEYRSRGYSSLPGHENVGAGHRAAMEEDVVFRLLCQPDKVGSLIGKGGTIVRALQNETGASIKIVDTPDLDERVVMISAREVGFCRSSKILCDRRCFWT